MALLNYIIKQVSFRKLLVSHHLKFTIFSYVVGVIWFLALVSEEFNDRTYFSENALLPGLIARNFNPGPSLDKILDSLKEEISHVRGVPSEWIQNQFRQMGLDVYTQNFSVHNFFGTNIKHEGLNTYAILRAPKSSSVEAVVLSTPYRGPNNTYESTLPSIALMIELAKYFSRHMYWSKDIIFLITEHETLGYQAWLNAYHNDFTSNIIESNSFDDHCGLIQGVINLEISSEYISSLNIKIEGLNGQLPNLDLFNLATELCAQEHVPPTFHSNEVYYSRSFSFEKLKHDLSTLLSMILLQSTGLANGGHGLFHRYGIQAITLTSNSDGLQKVSLAHVGRVLEGIFHSLNNLLEKFHQSFFFYLLPSTRRYVSIGIYMLPFAAIGFSILIKILYLFIEGNVLTSKFEDILKVSFNDKLWFILDIFISYILGTLVYCSPYLIENTMITKYSAEDLVWYIHIVELFSFILFIYFYNKRRTITKDNYCLKLSISLLNLFGFLAGLSLINISMAVILAIIYIPISVFLNFNSEWRITYFLVLIFFNPFFVMYAITSVQFPCNDETSGWYKCFIIDLVDIKKFLFHTIEDIYLFNNWNYKIVTLGLLPVWYQFLMLVILKCS